MLLIYVGLLIWIVVAGPPIVVGVIVSVITAAIFGSITLSRIAPFLGSTTMGATGVVTRGPLRRRQLPWSEITALEIENVLGRGGAFYALQAYRGKRLGGPLLGVAARTSDDPELMTKIATIRAAWAAATGMPS